MNKPYLSISYPDGKTRVVGWEKDAFTIGSDPGCDLTLSEPGIDPFQAAITRREDGYTVSNIGPTPATYLNYLPVVEAEIYPGDELFLGRVSLIFELARDEEIRAEAARAVEIVSGEKLETTVDSALPPASDRPAAGPGTPAAALDALYRAVRIIHGIEDPDRLIEKLLNLLTEVTGASRACFLAPDVTGELRPRAVAGAAEDKILISHSIVNRVRQTRSGVLCTNAETDSRFRGAASISLGKIRSAICVPVEWREKDFGILYLDARGFTRDFTAFTEDDLRLAEAIAAQAALALVNAARREELVRENISLKREDQLRFGMVAESPAMRGVLAAVVKLAPTPSTVLIRGETGTGKEVIARAIHLNSDRRSRPLVAVNCAAFPEALLYSELFGHEKGAFTGAAARRIGKFEQAGEGTIFLDEIAEMDPQSQVALLRILEERKLQRLGGNRDVPVAARVIAATNRDLDRLLEEGRFRRDLYYRLKVLEIFLPPLRERREDIEPLLSFYLRYFAREGLRKVEGIEKDALESILGYGWPGNVRELKNTVERILVLGSSPRITRNDIREIAGSRCQERSPDPPAAVESEEDRIAAALEKTGGNKKEAARLLGIHRATLYRKLNSPGREQE